MYRLVNLRRNFWGKVIIEFFKCTMIYWSYALLLLRVLLMSIVWTCSDIQFHIAVLCRADIQLYRGTLFNNSRTAHLVWLLNAQLVGYWTTFLTSKPTNVLLRTFATVFSVFLCYKYFELMCLLACLNTLFYCSWWVFTWSWG